MTDFFKFDEIAVRLSGLFRKTKKLKKIIRSVIIGWTLFTVVAAIWELIPKGEKLPEVDAQELIDAVSEKTGEAPEENEADKNEAFENAIKQTAEV